MNEVNKTMYIPLYGKAKVSKQNIILNDSIAEKIWTEESFPIHGKAKSKWLAYNMAMRARVFDDWTSELLKRNQDAIVIHLGCGLDSRCKRVQNTYRLWYDCDFPQVISIRRRYYEETECYKMVSLDVTDVEQLEILPDSDTAIVVMEGISMYLSNTQLRNLFRSLRAKYTKLHILMDIYTVFGAKASKYKNPVNDVGVTKLYGIDDMEEILDNLDIRFMQEHSFTPARLVNELKPLERVLFKMMFNERLYKKIYRLVELG